jgi:hypothetical protein
MLLWRRVSLIRKDTTYVKRTGLLGTPVMEFFNPLIVAVEVKYIHTHVFVIFWCGGKSHKIEVPPRGFLVEYVVRRFKCRKTLYYLDQQIHNKYMNNEFYTVSTPACFDAFASSSGSLILYLLKLRNQ